MKIDKGERYFNGTKYNFKTEKDTEKHMKAQENNLNNGNRQINWNKNGHKNGLTFINNFKKIHM